jgi:hypothetical protein
MKKSLITIALAVGFSMAAMHAAKADTIGYLPNKVGGRIAVTDDIVPTCQRGEKHAYIQAASGRIVGAGCWHFVESGTEIEVRWQDDTTYAYPASEFYRTQYGINQGYRATTQARNAL